jgi:hypothetical protein
MKSFGARYDFESVGVSVKYSQAIGGNQVTWRFG